MEESNCAKSRRLISSELKVMATSFLTKFTIDLITPLLSMFKCSNNQIQELQWMLGMYMLIFLMFPSENSYNCCEISSSSKKANFSLYLPVSTFIPGLDSKL